MIFDEGKFDANSGCSCASHGTFKWNSVHARTGPRSLASWNSWWNSTRPCPSNKLNSTYLTGIPCLTPSTMSSSCLLLTREIPCQHLTLIRNFVGYGIVLYLDLGSFQGRIYLFSGIGRIKSWIILIY